jgi:hypothetical protein
MNTKIHKFLVIVALPQRRIRHRAHGITQKTPLAICDRVVGKITTLSQKTKGAPLISFVFQTLVSPKLAYEP